jgi:hypothetical protein
VAATVVSSFLFLGAVLSLRDDIVHGFERIMDRDGDGGCWASGQGFVPPSLADIASQWSGIVSMPTAVPMPALV